MSIFLPPPSSLSIIKQNLNQPPTLSFLRCCYYSLSHNSLNLVHCYYFLLKVLGLTRNDLRSNRQARIIFLDICVDFSINLWTDQTKHEHVQPRNKVQFYVAGILLLSYLLSLKHAAELVSEQEVLMGLLQLLFFIIIIFSFTIVIFCYCSRPPLLSYNMENICLLLILLCQFSTFLITIFTMYHNNKLKLLTMLLILVLPMFICINRLNRLTLLAIRHQLRN